MSNEHFNFIVSSIIKFNILFVINCNDKGWSFCVLNYCVNECYAFHRLQAALSQTISFIDKLIEVHRYISRTCKEKPIKQ